jgi:hypothetical protein
VSLEACICGGHACVEIFLSQSKGRNPSNHQCSSGHHIFGVGDGTVDVQFGVSHANCRRSNLLTSVEAIAANSHANATKFGFPRTRCANKVGAGNFASNRNLAGTNERNSISACDMLLRGTIVREALSAASPLVGYKEAVQRGLSGPRRRALMFLGRPVMGLNILPAIVGSC